MNPKQRTIPAGLRSEAPADIHGWAWSNTFGRWSAYVTSADGWEGYTYPKHRSVER